MALAADEDNGRKREKATLDIGMKSDELNSDEVAVTGRYDELICYVT